MNSTAKSNERRRFSCLGLAAAAAFLLGSPTSNASTWTGATTNWNSNANPGWNGTGVPNAVGAVAEFTTGGTTTQNISPGVTIGTCLYRDGNNQSRAFTLSNKVTFDRDGAGPGSAVVSNAATRANDRLGFGSGTVTLADDILLTNVGSSSGSYSISFSSAIGGAGNMTIYNVSNSTNVAPVSLTGANTFIGTFWLQKGAVIFNNAGMGAAANPAILGSAGNGSATIVSIGSATTTANPITISSGSGGTLLLGSTEIGILETKFTGPITLNGDLTVTSSKTGAGFVTFSGILSGAGGIVKGGTGPVKFSNANTYQGGTAVTSGVLTVSGSGTLGSGGVTVQAGATLDLDTASAISDSAAVGLLKDGTAFGRVDLSSGVNETVGSLSLGGSLQPVGTYGATGSGADYVRDDYFVGTGRITAKTGKLVGTVIVVR